MASILIVQDKLLHVPEDGLEDDDFAGSLESSVKRSMTLPTLLLKKHSSAGVNPKLSHGSIAESNACIGPSLIDHIDTDYSPMHRISTDMSAIQRIQTFDGGDGWPVAPSMVGPVYTTPAIFPPSSFLSSPCMIPIPVSPSAVPALCGSALSPLCVPAAAPNEQLCNSDASFAMPIAAAPDEYVPSAAPNEQRENYDASFAMPVASAPDETSSDDEEDSTLTLTVRTPLRSQALAFVPGAAKAQVDSLVPPSAVPCAHLTVASITTTPPEAKVQSEENTTLILKNLPTGLSRDMLVDLLQSHGFKDSFDFIYLPVDFMTFAHFGYAFVNLTSTKSAEECKDKFDGFTDWGVQTDKVCEVALSEMHQGLDAHVQRYRDSPLMHPDASDEIRPALYKNGVRAAFPPPTKPIRAPRPRLRKGRAGK